MVKKILLKSKKIIPNISAGIVVMTLAQKEERKSIINIGNRASPSCEIALAKRAAKGIMPFVYKATNMI